MAQKKTKKQKMAAAKRRAGMSASGAYSLGNSPTEMVRKDIIQSKSPAMRARKMTVMAVDALALGQDLKRTFWVSVVILSLELGLYWYF